MRHGQHVCTAYTSHLHTAPTLEHCAAGPLPFMMVPQHDYYTHHSYLAGHYPPYFYPPQSYSPSMQGPALQTPGFSSGPGFTGGSRSAEPTPIQYYYPHGGRHYQPMHFIPPSPMPSPASDASSVSLPSSKLLCQCNSTTLSEKADPHPNFLTRRQQYGSLQ